MKDSHLLTTAEELGEELEIKIFFPEEKHLGVQTKKMMFHYEARGQLLTNPEKHCEGLCSSIMYWILSYSHLKKDVHNLEG